MSPSTLISRGGERLNRNNFCTKFYLMRLQKGAIQKDILVESLAIYVLTKRIPFQYIGREREKEQFWVKPTFQYLSHKKNPQRNPILKGTGSPDRFQKFADLGLNKGSGRFFNFFGCSSGFMLKYKYFFPLMLTAQPCNGLLVSKVWDISSSSGPCSHCLKDFANVTMEK
jgi:hypothetical protein